MKPPAARSVLASCALAVLAGCATVPAGPSLQSLPGSRMTPQQFAADDGECRAAAAARLGGMSPSDAANQNAAASAVAGTAIGAATGALLDGSSGAAAGAAMGLIFGAMAGTATSPGTFAAAQQQYDSAYYACMYARGHKVPVPAHSVMRYRGQYDGAPVETAPAAPPPPDLVPPDYRPPAPPR
jgi:hypothetical protein